MYAVPDYEKKRKIKAEADSDAAEELETKKVIRITKTKEFSKQLTSELEPKTNLLKDTGILLIKAKDDGKQKKL